MRAAAAALRILAVAGLALLPLTRATAQAAYPTCFGKPATIVGTGHRDVIHGTPGPDVIVAGDGPDVVYGEGGNDLICGGESRDTLFGGPGDDRMTGGPRGDVLYDGPGDDHVFGGSARNDALIDGRGNDVLIGGSPSEPDAFGNVVSFKLSSHPVHLDLAAGVAHGDGLDVIQQISDVVGSPFGDVLRGSAGHDGISGGCGNDRIFGGRGPDVLNGRVRGKGPCPTGSTDSDEIFGGPGNDLLEGEFAKYAGTDEIHGGSGDDYFYSYGGRETFDGGAGEDTFDADAANDHIRVDLAAGFYRMASHHGRLRSVEDAVGTRWNDVLRGGLGDNRLIGRGGADALFGGAGNDILLAGHAQQEFPPSLDSAYGGPGTDKCQAVSIRGCEHVRRPLGEVIFTADRPPASSSRNLLPLADHHEAGLGDVEATTAILLLVIANLRPRRDHDAFVDYHPTQP